MGIAKDLKLGSLIPSALWPVSALVGPNGTEKTDLCRTLEDQYFGTQASLVQIDMLEKGQVYHQPVGWSTFRLRRLQGRRPVHSSCTDHAHSLILLDEMEKAHPDVLNMLMQVKMMLWTMIH